VSSVWSAIEPLLWQVEKPARYIGGEFGVQSIARTPGSVNWLLVYPDTYEIGLPNQGLQILYEILNERSDATAERGYAPWMDFEALMREHHVPFFSVDELRPAREFDLIAFNLAAELTYTNVLNIIDLAGVAVRTSERATDDPIVLIGGHCSYNPEPLGDYVDAAVLGDGEEVVGEITEVVGRWKQDPDRTRESLHRALATISGVYVPSLYEPVYENDILVAINRRDDSVPPVVEKRTILDLGEWPYPKSNLVPLTDVVHDRMNVEVFRGCTRGCRFCQAGMITRPVRERPRTQVIDMVRRGIERTGYDEVALTSLSTADFSGIEDVVREIVDPEAGCGRVSVSLPSLRVDAFTVGTATVLGQGRRGGLTFAPEGGTWRMRRVINKLISEEDLFAATESAFANGWQRVKLYFLIGLPTETDEDVLGIAELGRRVVEIGRKYHKGVTVTASVGGFVPKPQTPFQWHGQDTPAQLQRKVDMLRTAARDVKGLTIRWHDPSASAAEGLASRGDRRMGRVIERVWRDGGTFQEWGEKFSLDRWSRALEAEGLSFALINERQRTRDELLPWDHLSAGLHEDFLWGEYESAIAEVGLEDCRWTPCYDCGACTTLGLEHVVASAVPPAGGSQGTGQGLDLAPAVPVKLGSRPS
jgi:radical SAM family uncharacterized protein